MTSTPKPIPTYPPGYLEENSSSPLVSLCIAFIVLEIVFVGLFILSRIQSKTAGGLENYLIPLALPFCLTNAIFGLVAVRWAGVGRHIAYVKAFHPEYLLTLLKIQFALVIVYPSAVNLPRLGLLFLYIRLFQVSRYRWVAYGVIFIIVLNWAVTQSILFAMCIPIKYNWDKTIKGGHCIDQQMFFRWGTIPNIVTDIIIFFLPMPIVFRVKMSTPQKIGVIFTFMSGSVGIFTAVLRLHEFIQLHAFADLTWYSVDTYLWAVIETGVYLIASTLPYLRSLEKNIFRDFDIRSLGSIFGGSQHPSEKSIRLKGNSSTVINVGNNTEFAKVGHEPYPPMPGQYSHIFDGTESKGEATRYSYELPTGNPAEGFMGEIGNSRVHVEKVYELRNVNPV